MTAQPRLLNESEIRKQAEKLSDWSLNKKSTELSKRVNTQSFVAGLAYCAKITVHAELLKHHPTIILSYNMVTITLTTHDVKGLTALDFELAKRINNLIVY